MPDFTKNRYKTALYTMKMGVGMDHTIKTSEVIKVLVTRLTADYGESEDTDYILAAKERIAFLDMADQHIDEVLGWWSLFHSKDAYRRELRRIAFWLRGGTAIKTTAELMRFLSERLTNVYKDTNNNSIIRLALSRASTLSFVDNPNTFYHL